ncbi:glycerophosphodiester phosphodiesterase family protein [Spirosoma sp.]|uniref:glycerophosphodiester phosphodiesterase n=2 Tax=unclassified Spirosoma TaxID=2621999 RepID=UPI000962F45A|nr:glycerophosphodiester phosphodiesterase family protein [Spirosoma sp.]MBN8826676.1 glycerophosphodiester phosphodiesterase family protein [Spirosoma sp.]OJW75042.1 MAG: glycerophosphodiester phosphodiesterase [Spirosoma sp. 48-14]
MTDMMGLKQIHLLGWLIISSIAYGQAPELSADSISYYRKALSRKPAIRVSAHRGNTGLAPENTLASFRIALQRQVDYIEIDVRTTKDGQLVILHDGNLNRTTNGTGPAAERTLADLKELSAGKGAGESFQAERIPTLAEVCQLVSDWNAHHRSQTNLYVDCKAVAAEPLVAMLTQYGLLNDAVFYGSDTFLQSLHKVAPKAKCMPSLRKSDELTAKIAALHPYAFDVNATELTKDLVDQLHMQGLRVFVDLLDEGNRPEYYQKAAQLGVDVIQTDHILNVYRTLARRATK